MAVISKLKPGQILFSLTSQGIGNTKIRRTAMHKVVVSEIDPDGKFVIASWNGNTPRKFFASNVAKWKVNEPKPKRMILGMPSY